MEEKNTRTIEVNCANASYLHGEITGIILGVIRDGSRTAIEKEMQNVIHSDVQTKSLH